MFIVLCGSSAPSASCGLVKLRQTPARLFADLLPAPMGGGASKIDRAQFSYLKVRFACREFEVQQGVRQRASNLLHHSASNLPRTPVPWGSGQTVYANGSADSSVDARVKSLIDLSADDRSGTPQARHGRLLSVLTPSLLQYRLSLILFASPCRHGQGEYAARNTRARSTAPTALCPLLGLYLGPIFHRYRECYPFRQAFACWTWSKTPA